MALQGTLDTFELSDVLRLLASTRKSGRLQLSSDRGDGVVWMADGQVLRVEAGNPGGTNDDALFELLRGSEGSFAFHAEAPTGDEPATDVEPMLAAAEALLAEWRTIEDVVPSLDAWVGLTPDLVAESVAVDRATWAVVATVGSGLTARELGGALDLGEVPVCRLVRDLVELGLVEVAASAPGRWQPAHAPAAEAPAPHPTFVVEEPAYALPPLAVDDEAVDDLEPSRYERPSMDASAFDEAERPEPVVAAELERSADRDDPADDSDDVSRQMAMMSPRAAQALAAAGTAPASADSAAAPGEEVGQDPGDRGPLLKFLSSVKG